MIYRKNGSSARWCREVEVRWPDTKSLLCLDDVKNLIRLVLNNINCTVHNDYAFYIHYITHQVSLFTLIIICTN